MNNKVSCLFTAITITFTVKGLVNRRCTHLVETFEKTFNKQTTFPLLSLLDRTNYTYITSILQKM